MSPLAPALSNMIRTIRLANIRCITRHGELKTGGPAERPVTQEIAEVIPRTVRAAPSPPRLVSCGTWANLAMMECRLRCSGGPDIVAVNRGLKSLSGRSRYLGSVDQEVLELPLCSHRHPNSVLLAYSVMRISVLFLNSVSSGLLL